MTSTLRLTRVFDRVVERQKPLLPWPDPEESIGAFYRTLGRYQCWEMRGRARQLYLSLANDIKGHLERHGDIVSATVIWSAYMIGKSKQCANPTVFFCSKDPKARRAVRNEIDGSGILESYSGFRTGDCTRPPHLGQLRQLAVGDDEVTGLCSEGSNTDCHVDVGRRIRIQSKDSTVPLTPATIGAILESGDSLYFTTAAHAFAELDADPFECESPMDSAFEWDFDGEHDGILAEDARQTAAYVVPEPGSVDWVSKQPTQDTNEPIYQSKDVRFSSADNPRPDSHLDYCLVEFKQEFSELESGAQYYTALPKDVNREGPAQGDVLVYTGSGRADNGVLSGTPSFVMLEGGRFSQELWTIHLDGTLENGDCGSIVINALSGNLEGHIIAGDPETGSALIVPAYQMLEDIQLRFDSNILLFQTKQCVDLQRPVTEEEITAEDCLDASESLHYDGTGTDWTAEITRRFRRMLSEQRMERLRLIRRGTLPRRSQAATDLSKGTREDSTQDHPTASDTSNLMAEQDEVRFSQTVAASSKASLGDSNQNHLTDSFDLHSVISREEEEEEEEEEVKFERALNTFGKAPLGDSNEDRPTNAPPPYHMLCLRNIPRDPMPPSEPKTLRFRSLLMSLSDIPCRWENLELLDEALTAVPLQRIHDEAQEEFDIFVAEAESLGEGKQECWGYQDCVIRALLRWFKRDFFEWVNNPDCSTCLASTVAMGICAPNRAEQARGCNQVELYQCSNSECLSWVRFPRYNDAFVLLHTTRGRVGEWANCFSMLCRALGSRVRWLWNAEDHVWTEVYSHHRKRWIHVDVCEEAWDTPLLYTKKWGKKMSYVIAFSSQGCYDVTRRYVRDSDSSLPRNRCSEEALWHIIGEITALRRRDKSADEIRWLKAEDKREEQELQRYVVETLVTNMLKSDSLKHSAGEKDAVSSTSDKSTATVVRRGRSSRYGLE